MNIKLIYNVLCITVGDVQWRGDLWTSYRPAGSGWCTGVGIHAGYGGMLNSLYHAGRYKLIHYICQYSTPEIIKYMISIYIKKELNFEHKNNEMNIINFICKHSTLEMIKYIINIYDFKELPIKCHKCKINIKSNCINIIKTYQACCNVHITVCNKCMSLKCVSVSQIIDSCPKSQSIEYNYKNNRCTVM